MHTRKTVYIAGPYRADTEEQIQQNIEHAKHAAIRLIKMGYAVHCPHMNTAGMHTDSEITVDDWMSQSLSILDKMDAIYMLRGWANSEGAKMEGQFAHDNHIEVWYEKE